MSNQTQYDSGSQNERLADVAEILAAGLMRLVARKSSQIGPRIGESSLDFLTTESGHPTPAERGISDG
jgi:hypothetical protein